MSRKISLFDDGGEEVEENLKINSSYAENYKRWRFKEVTQQLKDAESSSSSSDDDDTEEVKKVLDKDFFEAISSLKANDPRLYDQNCELFENEKKANIADPWQRKNKERTKNKDKPVSLRDYNRKLITERSGKISDEESDCEEKHDKEELKTRDPTYVEKQQALLKSIQAAVQEGDSDDEDILKKKEKSKEEKKEDEEEFIQWLKGDKKRVSDEETEIKLKPLLNIWNDPKLDEDEKFLKDYILNKRYLETADPYCGGLTDDDDDEEEEFEHKFNFRFEEPDQEFLKRYPRTIENSLRKKDTRRKEHRKEVKKRKEAEKLKQAEELKYLKSLKRKEIMDKIAKIKEITGNDQLGLTPEELDEDFNPEEHDKKMRELFNDDFYGGVDDAEDVEELHLPPLEEELKGEDDTYWDTWDGTDQNPTQDEQLDDGLHCEDPGFNMDCDYDPAQASSHRDKKAVSHQSAKEKRKLKRQSRFGRLVRKEKPVFDPKETTFQEYVDEYYGLEYEDLIGDLPCRFKYKSVVPNSFGLTIEEILAADDKELNQWASIKKTFTIREDRVEKNEVKIYAEKAKDEKLKRKILPSLFTHENESDTQNVNDQKNKKSKERNSGEVKNSSDGKDGFGVKSMASHRKRKHEGNSLKNNFDKNARNNFTQESSRFNKNFKKERKNGMGKSHDVLELSDARLAAYGLHPKRFRKKMLYGSQE